MSQVQAGLTRQVVLETLKASGYSELWSLMGQQDVCRASLIGAGLIVNYSSAHVKDRDKPTVLGRRSIIDEYSYGLLMVKPHKQVIVMTRALAVTGPEFVNDERCDDWYVPLLALGFSKEEADRLQCQLKKCFADHDLVFTLDSWRPPYVFCSALHRSMPDRNDQNAVLELCGPIQEVLRGLDLIPVVTVHDPGMKGPLRGQKYQVADHGDQRLVLRTFPPRIVLKKEEPNEVALLAIEDRTLTLAVQAQVIAKARIWAAKSGTA